MNQVQEVGLFQHVTKYLSSANSCCTKFSGHKDNLPDIAASVCCQGAEFLAGKYLSSNGFCCRETCVKCFKANGDKPITVVSGTVVNGNSEQGVDVLVPSFLTKAACCGSGSSCRMHPKGDDVLTALLLALPMDTWSGIKDEKLMQEMHRLVSTENLPTLLQEEVYFTFFCYSYNLLQYLSRKIRPLIVFSPRIIFFFRDYLHHIFHIYRKPNRWAYKSSKN